MFTIFFILGIIFSIITIFVVKDIRMTARDSFGVRSIHMKYWEIIILCLSYFLPFLGICIFIAFNIWFLLLYNSKNYTVELNHKNVFHRIFLKAISILNKTIN